MSDIGWLLLGIVVFYLLWQLVTNDVGEDQ